MNDLINMGLVKKKLTNIWRPDYQLSDIEKKTLILSLEILSKGKGIKLVDDALKAWDILVRQDIQAGNFEFTDIIEAMNKAVRMTMYNRIDYSDIYEIACSLYKQRTATDKTYQLLNERKLKSGNGVTNLSDQVEKLKQAFRNRQ